MASNTEPTFRFSKLLRDAMAGEMFTPGARLNIARPIDAEGLVGRHEGRARPAFPGVSQRALSSALQSRIGSSRKAARHSGRGGKFKFDPRQRAVVKIHYFSHGGGGAAALGAHARYVARDGAARTHSTPPLCEHDKPGASANAPTEARSQAHARYLERGQGRSVFYDAFTDGVDGAERAAIWARDDRRHFRIILSAENASRLRELRTYTREVMRRAAFALGTRLDWVAVDHWDTANPHTHIILRGRHEDGRDLVIPRDYVSHGFRGAAQDVATERLGPRGRGDARRALERETRSHGPTRLDRLIANQLDDHGRVRIAQLSAPDRSPVLSDALKARARELKRLGLAAEISRNVLRFEPGWRDALKAMELHLDIRKALVRARSLDLASSRTDPVRQLSKALKLPPGMDR